MTLATSFGSSLQWFSRHFYWAYYPICCTAAWPLPGPAPAGGTIFYPYYRDILSPYSPYAYCPGTPDYHLFILGQCLSVWTFLILHLYNRWVRGPPQGPNKNICFYQYVRWGLGSRKNNLSPLPIPHPHPAGLGGSVGCAVRLETRRSRVQPPPRSATFFRGDWSWNIFYGHSLPSDDSRRAVVSFCRKNVHNTG